MPHPIASIEADFEALVQHLSALLDHHADDRNFVELDRLRAARDKAATAIELIRQSRKSLD